MEYDDDEDSLDEDSEEEGGADAESNLTALELERKRRAKLLKKLEYQAHAPKRPEIVESLKLRPFFQEGLSEIFRTPGAGVIPA